MKVLSRYAAIFLVAALVQVIPATAQGATEDLALSMLEGTLTISGSDEPSDLEAPVTLGATVDTSTGVITDGTFAAAPVSFEYPVEDFGVVADIAATFTQVAPGTAIGSVSLDGDVAIDLELRADLDIQIRDTTLNATCEATPITVRLRSSSPYDPDTERVHLQDPNFTIPAISTADPCGDLIGGPVNEALSGSGHSIEMTMEGAIPVLEAGIHDTVTTVTASSSTVRVGDEVALTATVESAEPGVPSGRVEFFAGTESLGSTTVDGSGTALLVTTGLPEGTLSVTANYYGDDVYKSSTSAGVVINVVAVPSLDLDVSERILIGGDPEPVITTISNAADGLDVDNARLDIKIARAADTTSSLAPNHLLLEVFDGSDWTPVDLTASGATALVGRIGPATGFSLPADGSETIEMRITAPLINNVALRCRATETVCPGPIEVEVVLAEVDPVTGDVVREVLSATTTTSFLHEESLRESSLFLPPGVNAHTVRPGYQLNVAALVQPALPGYRFGGTAQVLFDGLPAQTRQFGDSYEDELTDVMAANHAGGIVGQVFMPDDVTPGEHTLTIRYSGDEVFGPSEVTANITVLPSVGAEFRCEASTNIPDSSLVGVELTMEADLPSVVANNGEFDLSFDTAELRMGRSSQDDGVSILAPHNEVGEGWLRDIRIGFGDNGQGTARSITQTNMGMLPPDPYPADEADADRILTFNDATGSFRVDGSPGEEVPVVVDELVIDLVLWEIGLPVPMTCTPLHEAIVLGTVTLAGTELTVDPTESVIGDDVTFTATVKPSPGDGTVVFRTAEGVLGAADVDADGRAVFTTSALSVGTHEVTAQFQGNDEVPANESDAVTVTVLEEAVDPPVTEPPGTEPGSTEPGSTEPPGSEGPGGDGQGGPSPPGSTSGNKALPRTGADSKPMISLALAMAGLGVAVLGSRRFLFRK